MREFFNDFIRAFSYHERKSLLQQAPLIRIAKWGLVSSVLTLTIGIEGALAICPCGDGFCNKLSANDENTCLPPETPNTCPADCKASAELTVRVTVVPFGDTGRFNIHNDGSRIATNLSNGQSTGPHRLLNETFNISQTAGSNTNLSNYRTIICGACAVNGNVVLGAETSRSCSFTNLRPAPPATPKQISSARRLSIARYARPGMASANLTDADADRILASMSDVLRTRDGANDVACNVAFCRDFNIRDYAIGDGIIDTQGELDDVFAIEQDVKVTRRIDFCASMGGLGSYNGCASESTRSFVVKRTPHDGVVWAHEYGHVRGLGHREPDDPDAVMTGNGTSSTSREVSLDECTAYLSGAPLDVTGISLPESVSDLASKGLAAQTPSLRDFVHKFFIHGVPYEEALRYGIQDVPVLLDMLSNSREKEAWLNIVILLGMLGDDRAIEPLISLIKQDTEGDLDYFEYEAKINAIFGLGYLINKNGSKTALTYLRDSLDPSVWTERGITWTYPEHETEAERNQELSRVAIIGLGLSGHPSAEEALRELQTPVATEIGREFRERTSGVIAEALKANQRIAEQGLAEYYRK